jgi:flagellar motor switch protein FliN/FliY
VPIEVVSVEEAAQDIDPERSSFSPVFARLPVELDVMVPVRDFRVRNLLSLVPGQVIESEWGHCEDVPVAAGEIPLAWSEFEVIENQLAVRITRLS